MTPNLGKTTFSPHELGQLRAETSAFIDRHGWTAKQFAEECEVPEGTFGPWLADKYPGSQKRIDEVASVVNRFLVARKEQAEMAATIPVAPMFQETPTARRIWAGLEHAQVFGDLTVVGVGPGMGKTETTRQYRKLRPRVWVATMAPSTRGVPNALIEVLGAMGDQDARGTPQALSRRVAAKATSGGLLVIDEAQHLSQQAVDEFRSIHDKTGVGLVFSGDESVFSLFDGSRRSAFAQFHSRIGYRVRLSRPDPKDAVVIAAAHGVTETQLVKLCGEIASKPGALRGLTKTLLLAKRMAAMASEPLTATLIREAYAQRAADQAA
ncbi:AAA family ATPase [Brevundimonas vitis]|uniref:AAA family ATPase n=1 Tax=Brevundimonas vitisensis TaxID=2800818 RepID=A0ABX7BN51_9CAUL|nr:AAA family ATPase [Brevundimonas vitisensis]QQQ17776.1 AAA family ATPase [Brevundimonas vitisensis]